MKKLKIWLCIKLAVAGGMSYGVWMASKDSYPWFIGIFVGVLVLGAFLSYKFGYRKGSSN